MSNIRMLWNNVADTATVAVSSKSGTLTGANMRTDIKTQVWRSATYKESIVCAWDSPQPVGVVCLAFNNFTALATMRVRGYTEEESLFPEFDTGDVQCAPPAPLGQFAWGQSLGENFYQRGGAGLFPYGYGSYGVVWVPGGRAVRRLEIIINDPTNPDTFLEVGRLIVGPWWSPEVNFNFNHNVSFPELTENKRTDAGDLRGEPGAKWKRIEFDLGYMDAEDRAAMIHILRRNGLSKPVFLSLFPEDTDKMLEQTCQVWGKLADAAKLSQPRFDIYATQIAVEET